MVGPPKKELRALQKAKLCYKKDLSLVKDYIRCVSLEAAMRVWELHASKQRCCIPNRGGLCGIPERCVKLGAAA